MAKFGKSSIVGNWPGPRTNTRSASRAERKSHDDEKTKNLPRQHRRDITQ